jgi:hypothetical protein
MKLVPGKLYRIMKQRFTYFRDVNVSGTPTVPHKKGNLILFLKKGKTVSCHESKSRYAYTLYYFLLGEKKVVMRKYYDDKIGEIFTEAGEERYET